LEQPIKGDFYKDLRLAFAASNIPLNKLQNPVLKAFLEKYTNRHVADESNVRRYHMPKCYSTVMEKNKQNIGDNYIWISAHETTDIVGRCVVTVCIGILHPTIQQG
jgi:hypothetical protein